MKTALRITGKLLLGLIGLLILVIIILKLITDNQYREWINGAVSDATGREFSIDGLELDFGTTLRAKAEGVSLANAAWSEQPEALAARSLEAEIRLLALFRGLADVTAVGDGIYVSVESGPDGESNWQLGGAAQEEPVAEQPVAKEAGGLPIRPFIRRLALLDTEIISAVGPPTLPRTLTISEFSITTPESDTLVQLDAALDEYPLRLSGNLGPLDRVLDTVSAPLSLDASLADITLGIDGQWGPLVPAPDLAAQLNIAAPSISDVLNMAGIEIADPGSLDVSAELVSNDGQVSLQSVETSVGGELVTLSALGGIADVNALEGIDFNVMLDTDTLYRLVTHFGVELPGELPALATVQAHVHGGIGVLSISDIEIQVGDDGLSAEVTGDINNIVSLSGVSAEFSADVASTGTLSKFVGMDIPAIGAVSLAGQLNDAEGTLALRDFTAGLANNENLIRVSGEVADLMRAEGIDAGVTVDIKAFSEEALAEITRVLAQNDIDFSGERLPQSITLEARVAGGMNVLAVSDLEARVADSGLELTLAGGVDNAMDLSGAQAVLTLKGPVTEVLREQAGLTLPEAGSLDLTATVEYIDNVARLTAVEGGLSGGIADVSLRGSIADLASVSGIDVVIDLALDALTEAERNDVEALLAELEVTGVPLELLPASVAWNARISGSLEQLSLDEATGEVEDTGVVIGITGRADDLLTQQGIEADVAIDVDSVASLSRYAQTELPELGALDIDARLLADGGVYTLDQLQAALKGEGLNLTAAASISDLIARKGIAVDLEGGVDSLSALSEAAATDLPDTPPVALTARLEGTDGGGAVLKASVSSGEASVDLESSLSNLLSPDDLVLTIQAEAATLAELSDFAGRDIPDVGPFSLGAVISVDQTKREYSLQDFLFELDEHAAGGAITVKLADEAGGRTDIRGNLDVRTLDLSPFIIPDDISRQMEGEVVVTEVPATDTETGSVEEGDSANAQPALVSGDAKDVPTGEEAEVVSTDRLFPDDPIVLEQMREVDIDFSLTAEEIILGKMDLEDFEGKLVLDQGKLRLSPFTAVDEGGKIDGDITIDGSGDSMDMLVSLLIEEIRLPISGGMLNLNVDLDGSGATPAQLMAGLDGQILLWIRDGVIPSSFATRFGSGLFSFGGNEQTTDLECAVVRMDVTDGYVDFEDKIVAQLTGVNWLGGGDIDLHTEAIGVGITPKPREGIGIGAGTLASLVYIGGTLKNPGVRLNPADVAVKYGKYMAYISTGGLSLLAEALFNKARAGNDFCAPLLEETVFEQILEEVEISEAAEEAS